MHNADAAILAFMATNARQNRAWPFKLLRMIEKAPIVFIPSLKSVIWGGNRICSYKGIPCTDATIGESWEISAIPGRDSVVESGTYAGRQLSELARTFGAELLGTSVVRVYGDRFPLIVKFIDAAHNLSVQVHPDDALAMQRHNSPGKTEMWYVIDSAEDSKVYVGLNREMTPAEYLKHVEEGTVESILAAHDSHPGDVFYLPAGRVHTIGPGNLVAEIQEASDITYRIYDYNRRDASGRPRELHTDLATDAIDFKSYDNYKLPPVPDTLTDARLLQCPHFSVNRVLLDGELALNFDRSSFTVVMCVSGSATLNYPGGSIELSAGHTVLCPAVLDSFTLTGKGVLLYSRA